MIIMKFTKNNHAAAIGAAILAALALTLSACSGETPASGQNEPATIAPESSAPAVQESTAPTDQSESQPAAVGSFRTVEEIKASGKVIIGVFSDKNPFGYIDASGKYQGYDVYFAERIAKDLGVAVEYVSVEPASRVEFLETGKVDIILANFTVTAERAEKVDFALPYMKVALGVVSPDSALITDVSQLAGKTLIVAKGTTAETYFTENHPEVNLLKFDQYTETFNALLDGRADAFSTDNTEVLAWALTNPGYTVGIPSLGGLDTIAPAVQKGNTDLLNWLDEEIKALGNEQFFHADYAATLAGVYGSAIDPSELVVEGGVLEAGITDAETITGSTLKVGATSVPHAEILEFVKPLLEAQGLTLEITEFQDYVLPNTAVEDGQLDANFFQHTPYLESFNAERGTHLVDVCDVHYEPFGIFPGKTKSLDALPDGAQIAVPNDTTNEARALLLLETAGLIKVDPSKGLEATVNDITDNPKNLKIVELEAAQIPRALQDVDVAAINGNYALEAGLSVDTDSLFVEPADSLAADTFANVLVVKDGNQKNPEINALIMALTSEDTRAFIQTKYGKAVIPKF
jgi:YaeC family lipoprotein